MAKRKRSAPEKGPCVDCENCLAYDSGEAYGQCLAKGHMISHIEAYADHDCFRQGVWFAGGYGDDDDQDI